MFWLDSFCSGRIFIIFDFPEYDTSQTTSPLHRPVTAPPPFSQPHVCTEAPPSSRQPAQNAKLSVTIFFTVYGGTAQENVQMVSKTSRPAWVRRLTSPASWPAPPSFCSWRTQVVIHLPPSPPRTPSCSYTGLIAQPRISSSLLSTQVFMHLDNNFVTSPYSQQLSVNCIYKFIILLCCPASLLI